MMFLISSSSRSLSIVTKPTRGQRPKKRESTATATATKGNEKEYLAWVARYLYYFDFNLDQRFYNAETEEERISGTKGKIMLVPKGAKKPKVFQRKHPIKNCLYISNPKTFYPQMNKQ